MEYKNLAAQLLPKQEKKAHIFEYMTIMPVLHYVQAKTQTHAFKLMEFLLFNSTAVQNNRKLQTIK